MNPFVRHEQIFLNCLPDLSPQIPAALVLARLGRRYEGWFARDTGSFWRGKPLITKPAEKSSESAKMSDLRERDSQIRGQGNEGKRGKERSSCPQK